MKRRSKGEWSEAHVFLKLFLDAKLHEADEQGERVGSSDIDTVTVLRKQSDLIVEYVRDGEQGLVIVVGGVADGRSVPASDLAAPAREIVKAILGTGATRTAGYSIKSFVGNAPTLFNAAVASGLVYRIEGAGRQDADRINMLLGDRGQIDIEARIKLIKDEFCLMPVGTAIVDGHQPFADNLEVCGTDMLALLQEALLYRYGAKGWGRPSRLSDCIDRMVSDNPMGVRRPEAFYPARFKQFAYDAFAGLSATNPWNGVRRLNGGYIDVRSDGEVLYHPAVSDDSFTSYLLKNLRFEGPDKGIGGLEAAAEAYQRVTGKVPAALEARLADKAGKRNAVRGDYGYAFFSEAYGDPGYFFTLNFSLRFT